MNPGLTKQEFIEALEDEYGISSHCNGNGCTHGFKPAKACPNSDCALAKIHKWIDNEDLVDFEPVRGCFLRNNLPILGDAKSKGESDEPLYRKLTEPSPAPCELEAVESEVLEVLNRLSKLQERICHGCSQCGGGAYFRCKDVQPLVNKAKAAVESLSLNGKKE